MRYGIIEQRIEEGMKCLHLVLITEIANQEVHVQDYGHFPLNGDPGADRYKEILDTCQELNVPLFTNREHYRICHSYFEGHKITP